MIPAEIRDRSGIVTHTVTTTSDRGLVNLTMEQLGSPAANERVYLYARNVNAAT